MIDPRTGLIDRAWYMFFLGLYDTASVAQDAVIGPDTDSLLASFDAQLRALSDEVGTQYDAQSGVASLAAALAALEQQFAVQPSTEIGELQQQIDALAQAVAIQPAALPLNSGAFFNIIGPATAGSAAYGNGSSIAFSAAGSSGQLLASGGTGAPTWTSLSSIGVTTLSFGTTGLTPATATSGAITVAGTLAVANGGTGQTSYTDGQLLIGNTTGNTLAKATLTASTGISVTNGAGSITLTNTAPDQVVSLTGAGTTTISGTYPSFTITSNDTYVGTVTSVGLSLPTQFTVTNSPVTSSGTLTAAWNTQTANYVLAGPTTGTAAVPTFRALVAGDVPALSYVSSVSATAPITSTGGLTPTIAVTSAALTKTDDTNVTLTLGGSPTTALLAASSLTLGWSGTLSVARGGTAKSSWTTNGVVYASGTTTLANGSVLVFDGSNLGIGAASPVNPLTVTSDTSAQVRIGTVSANINARITFAASGTGINVVGTNGTSALGFYSGSTEQARFDTSGNFLLNTTTNSGTLTVKGNQYNASSIRVLANGNVTLDVLNASGTEVGYIQVNGAGTGTVYATSSDQRLKENIADAADAGAFIDAIQVRQFDWISSGTHEDYGLIAQELMLVRPDAVSHGQTEDSMKAVDYSKLVPLLVKEIQHLRARVAVLEVR